jgi:hypothetical protein
VIFAGPPIGSEAWDGIAMAPAGGGGGAILFAEFLVGLEAGEGIVMALGG